MAKYIRYLAKTQEKGGFWLNIYIYIAKRPKFYKKSMGLEIDWISR
jgi:hypothetical protein